ncbi:hypothetical protein [Janibacter sp. G1551]|uniref:hypothetical protein n=1 Tax=Janibacter sp. G1551 TaxID=3420440 RepID=UPI003CFD3C12
MSSTTRRAVSTALVMTLCLLALGGCAAAGNDAVSAAPGAPGFWLGLWHGAISPITFVISLFRDDVGIYAVHNRGTWYDFGFVAGASIAFSGAAGSRTARRRS